MGNSNEVMKCQRKKKLDAIEKFGGKCQECGYDKCINALEFHHLDDKKEKPTYIIMRWSWERVKKELEKCILLCANCHREVHYKARDIDPTTNRYVFNWLKKVCKNCQKEFETKKDGQVFCCITCKQIYQRRAGRPNKQELEALIQQFSFLELGRKFGVSDNAVRKWCKSENIETKNRKFSHNSPKF